MYRIPTRTNLFSRSVNPSAETPFETLNQVCAAYNLTTTELFKPTRELRICWPRQVFQSLCVLKHQFTYPQAAAFFRMDHTSAINAMNVVKNLASTNEERRAELERLDPELVKTLLHWVQLDKEKRLAKKQALNNNQIKAAA